MFLMLLLISTLILTCLAIRSAADTAALNIRKSLMGSFTVNAGKAKEMLEESTVKEMLSIPGMTDHYNLRSYFNAEYCSVDGKKLIIQIDALEPPLKGYEHAGKIVSGTRSDMDSYFLEAGFKLDEGRHITKEDTSAAVVSRQFAKTNGLKLGSHIVLKDIHTRKQLKVKIVGIFQPGKKPAAVGRVPSTDLYDNVCFTDQTAYAKLAFEGSRGHYQYGDFYVDDPARLDSVIKRVKDLSGMDWKHCRFTKHDADYQHAKASLESLQRLVTVMVILLDGGGIFMLILILLLWIRNRIHETGMLLAVGISKRNILLQHLTELLIIAVFAFTMSFVTSSFIAQQAGDKLMKRASAEVFGSDQDLTGDTLKDREAGISPNLELITVDVSVSDLLAVYGIGGGMIFVSVLAASYPVLRLKPKEILAKMS